MSQNHKPLGTLVECLPSKPETIPPRDGTWIEATVVGKGKVAIQFDQRLARWFTGKGHALREQDIRSWTRWEL